MSPPLARADLVTPFFVVFLREVSKASEAQVISGEVLRPTHTV